MLKSFKYMNFTSWSAGNKYSEAKEFKCTVVLLNHTILNAWQERDWAESDFLFRPSVWEDSSAAMQRGKRGVAGLETGHPLPVKRREKSRRKEKRRCEA